MTRPYRFHAVDIIGARAAPRLRVSPDVGIAHWTLTGQPFIQLDPCVPLAAVFREPRDRPGGRQIPPRSITTWWRSDLAWINSSPPARNYRHLRRCRPRRLQPGRVPMRGSATRAIGIPAGWCVQAGRKTTGLLVRPRGHDGFPGVAGRPRRREFLQVRDRSACPAFGGAGCRPGASEAGATSSPR